MVPQGMQDGHVREVLGDELHGGVDGEQVGGVALRPHVVGGEVARHVPGEQQV